MSKKIKIIKEKVYDPRSPKKDLDYVELSLDGINIDNYVKKYGSTKFFEKSTDTESQQSMHKKKERLIKKIFKAASLTLTDIQFQVFILRHVVCLKQADIAAQLKVNQSYVAAILKACNHKIKKILRLKLPQKQDTEVNAL